MEDVSEFKNFTYTFRKTDPLYRINVNSVKYETETVSSLGAKIWKFCLMTTNS